MRGKDYDLLDQELVQARLAQPPDQQTTHPETRTCRALFDFPDLLLSPSGPHTRVIVAARAIPDTPVKVGTIRGEHVYELFYTALPPGAFTPADVVALYLHRGAFETVLSDEDKEQAPDRWCSHTRLRMARPHSCESESLRASFLSPVLHSLALEPLLLSCSSVSFV